MSSHNSGNLLDSSARGRKSSTGFIKTDGLSGVGGGSSSIGESGRGDGSASDPGGEIGDGSEDQAAASRRPAWMRSGVASEVASSLAAKMMESNAQFVFKGTMRGGCALLAILSLFLASCQIISLLQEQHEW